MIHFANSFLFAGLVLGASFPACINSGPEALGYAQLLASSTFPGEMSGFCSTYFTDSDLIRPITNLTCAGDGASAVKSLKNLMGGLSPKCQAFFGQAVCLFHLPLLEQDLPVLPCTQTQSLSSTVIDRSNKLLAFFEERCTTVTSADAIQTVLAELNQIDDLLDQHLELRTVCRVMDARWIPDFEEWSCPASLKQMRSTNVRTNAIGCAQACPSPAYSDSDWGVIRKLVLIPNTISLVAVIATLLLRRRINTNAGRRIWNFLICVAGIHVSIGFSSVAELLPNRSVFSISCANDHTAAETTLACGAQGALLVYFIRACVAWWVIIVTTTAAETKGRKQGSMVVWYWFGYAYSALWVIIALATQKIQHADEFAWCYVSSERVGFWQYWFLYGDITVMIILTIAIALRNLTTTTNTNNISQDAQVTKTEGNSALKNNNNNNNASMSVALCVYGVIVWTSLIALRILKSATAHDAESQEEEWLSCLFETISSASNTTSGSALSELCQRDDAPHATLGVITTVLLCLFGSVASMLCLAFQVECGKVVSVMNDVGVHFTHASSPNDNNKHRTTNSHNHNHTAMAVFGVSKSPVLDDDGAQCFDFVILGGGTAALFAARKFAESKEKYSVAVVSREANTPFCPKVLVQALADNAAPEVSIMQEEEWFREHGITLLLNTNVTSVDMKSRVLTADRSDKPKQQHHNNTSPNTTHVRIKAMRALILAMGAKPLPGPPLVELDDNNSTKSNTEDEALSESVRSASTLGNKSTEWSNTVAGYFVLRTYDGGLRINQCLEKAERVVVVGGGFLGLDVAYIARSRGKHVTLICSSQYVLRRIFTPEMSRMYQEFFASHGVQLVMKNQCTRVLSRKGKVVGVELLDGTRLSCDMCVVACGVAPNVELARGQLQLEKGTSTPAILVDSFLATSVPGVYAIGDVCAMRYAQHNPGAIRHCSNARLGGAHVVETLLGAIQTSQRRASRVSPALSKGLKMAEKSQPEQLLELLKPGMGAKPFVPHPAYDVNHFHFKGYVSGDRLGPDFVMVGTDMSPHSKLVTLWLWENRVVGAYVSNPTEEEKRLLDEATRDQWYVEGLPQLRAMVDANEALQHLRTHHRDE